MNGKELLADALRRYPSWGEAYLAERRRAEAAEAALAEYLEEIKQLVRSRDMYVGQRDEARTSLADTRRALTEIASVIEAWDNDETPDVDLPFNADMDFLNYVGHVARHALAATGGGTGQEQQP